jgi:hypothetical protein
MVFRVRSALLSAGGGPANQSQRRLREVPAPSLEWGVVPAPQSKPNRTLGSYCEIEFNCRVLMWSLGLGATV